MQIYMYATYTQMHMSASTITIQVAWLPLSAQAASLIGCLEACRVLRLLLLQASYRSVPSSVTLGHCLRASPR